MGPSLLRPGPHPDPPADLATRRLPLHQGTPPWFRCHGCQREPLYFGAAGTNRFDAPAGQFGVLYVGSDPHCAFIETFGHSIGINVVDARALAGRCLSRVEVARPLALVDLTGPGLARLGADERLNAADHMVAQRWSFALWSHPAQPDGLCYRARHDPSRLSVALFDRAARALHATNQGSLGAPHHATLVRDILATYGFALIDGTTRD